MNVEAIIFDFGDTIATLKPSKEQIVSEFLASKGINMSLEKIKYAYRIVDYCHKQSALKLKTPNEKKEFLIKLNSEVLKVMGLSATGDFWSLELYQRFLAKRRWGIFSDTLPALEQLHKLGFKMAILANWDRALKEVVKSVGIDQYFSHILSSEEISMEKPDPMIFRHVLKLISVKPENSIYVGNEYETDVLGARNANFIPVLIDRSNYWPHADCLKFEDLTGLLNYLKNT